MVADGDPLAVSLAADDWGNQDLRPQHEFIAKAGSVADLLVREFHEEGPDQAFAVLSLSSQVIEVRQEPLSQAQVSLHDFAYLIVIGKWGLAEATLVIHDEEQGGKDLPFQIADGHLGIVAANLAINGRA